MGITVSFEVEQSEAWDRFWLELGRVGEVSRREAEIIADAARRGIADNFEHERSPDGAPWVPLAPLTRRIRAEGIDDRGVPFRTGAAHPILVRTGDLKRSFVDRNHPRNVTRVTRGDGVVQVLLSAQDDPQTPGRIALLNDGGDFMTATWGAELVLRHVPARPFIGLSDRALAQVDEQARRVLLQRVERLG